ncbi:Pentatricopeptide repeat-containing protein [Heracleum sosnowskyi]|uniref:Pentatricopeptide repeat-containing protein n=1 Tax=Heracleum sosnowskyi TaxID=360622 RepID=A0AAD8HR45_9APIA|nr:Pentatricopeptide repeat-containing protein [Heracleum sosnowskyi]
MKCLPRILNLISPAISATAVRLIHTTLPPEPEIIASICGSLRKGSNFPTLTKKFTNLNLNKNTQIIPKILLQLKQPHDANWALKFFHWAAHDFQIQHSPFDYCITIHILAHAKLVKDAQALLESVLSKVSSGKMVLDLLFDSYEISESTPFVFDLFLQCCAKLKMIDDAVSACEMLDKKGFNLSVISYNSLINVVLKSEKSGLVWRVYEGMIRRRVCPNEFTMRVMVSGLCKEGRLGKFLDVVERIHGKKCLAGVVVNTCLVYGMIDEGRVEDGLGILKWLLQRNLILDSVSYGLVVFARVKIGDLAAALEVYEEMIRRGFSANVFVHTLFIGAYCEEGKVDEAIELFNEIEYVGMKPYDETFNHLILGCARAGRLEDSLRFCDSMIDAGLVSSCVAFNELVKMLCANGGTKRADDILTYLLDKGFVPNEKTYSRLIAGYQKERNLQGVLKLYYEMEYKLLPPSSSVFASVIAAVCHSGDLKEAEKYFKTMKDKSIVPCSFIYEDLINAHIKKGNKARGDQLYHELLNIGHNPSIETHLCDVAKS